MEVSELAALRQHIRATAHVEERDGKRFIASDPVPWFPNPEISRAPRPPRVMVEYVDRHLGPY